LVVQAKAYLANPSASLLAQIQTQIVTFQQQVNSALMKTGRIIDPLSQKHALAAVQAVATIVSAMLALVLSISSKATVAQMAAESPIKQTSVRNYLDDSKTVATVAAHYGESLETARIQAAQAEMSQSAAGF
jgi:hypothetical protein